MRWGCVSLLVLPVLVVASVCGRAEWLNDRILDRYKAALYDYPLPPQSEVVARNSGVAIFFGNGNHCDISVVQVLGTPLSADDVERYYRGTDIVERLRHEDPRGTWVAAREVEPGDFVNGHMDLWGISQAVAPTRSARWQAAGKSTGQSDANLVRVLLARAGDVFRDHEQFDMRCH